MIRTWEDRLAAGDHSKGTRNTMIQTAMLSEIKALRKRVAAYPRALRYARQSAQEWRKAASKYQKQLGELRGRKENP